MRIVVLDGHTLNPGDNPWDPVAALGEIEIHPKTQPGDIVDRSAGAEIVLTNKTPLDADTLDQLPSLRFIGVLATGYNIVDVEAARRQGIVVSNVPEYSTDSVAQFVFALLLELCHHVARHDDAVHQGQWAESGHFSFCVTPQVELAGLILGIVGFGRIGRRTGVIAHALGMKVLATGPRPRAIDAGYPYDWRELEALFAEADVISLHCPLTSENTEIVNRALLKKMKPSAFLINTARGGLVNEHDLAEALREGVLGGAACDVVSREPLPPDNPLLCAPNLTLTPHIAWASLAARRRLMQATADNIRAFQAGRPINTVT